MEETSQEPRVGNRPDTEQSEESLAQETPTAIVARLLANPRRVRL